MMPKLFRWAWKTGTTPRHDDQMQYGLVAIPVDDHDVAREPPWIQTILLDVEVPLVTKNMIRVEDTRRVAFCRRNRPGVIQQLTQLIHRVARLPVTCFRQKLMEHVSDRAFQEGDPPLCPQGNARIRPS